jgi:hypothetical protein
VKLLGVVLVALPFLVVTVAMVVVEGWGFAAQVLGIVLAACACIVGGGLLLGWNK